MLIEKWVFCVRLILQISAGPNLITANDQLHLSSWAVCFLLWDWYTDTGGPLGPGGIKDKFWGLPIANCLLPIVGLIHRHGRSGGWSKTSFGGCHCAFDDNRAEWHLIILFDKWHTMHLRLQLHNDIFLVLLVTASDLIFSVYRVHSFWGVGGLQAAPNH